MTVYRNKKELIAATVPKGSRVLDVGFSGQGADATSPSWVHRLIYEQTKELWGVDLAYDIASLLAPQNHYYEGSAESFSLPQQFDVVFAGDLIEHLSNPGLFLDSAKRHLAPGGTLVLTTPNTFNLFNLAEKITKDEPTVNADHTMYFNTKTLTKLLEKNGWKVEKIHYLYSLDLTHKESFKKKFLNAVYAILASVTPKFVETLVVVARPL